jgi:hypothetical protein
VIPATEKIKYSEGWSLEAWPYQSDKRGKGKVPGPGCTWPAEYFAHSPAQPVAVKKVVESLIYCFRNQLKINTLNRTSARPPELVWKPFDVQPVHHKH